MIEEAFIAVLAILALVFFRWAFQTLPHEGWQILASVPTAEEAPHQWRGVNITYYGVLIATALVASLAIFLVLMSAVGVPVATASALVGLILVVCVPAAKVVAMLVEKKKHTFTVGGASFMGILCAPVAVWITDRVAGLDVGPTVPAVTMLAALSIAYAIGEGLGRLACISFGCCYGRPLAECPRLVQRLLDGRGFVFSGKTKKITYESGLDGCEVVPVQALTAVMCTAAGLVGMLLYLKGLHSTAFVLAMTVTQAWRALSETMRADYRGGGRISAYQVMAAGAMVYVIGWAWVLPGGPTPAADIAAGLVALWNPGVILCLEAVWLLAFLYTGRSVVTGATLSFHVHTDRI